jgi:hypothetical protein
MKTTWRIGRITIHRCEPISKRTAIKIAKELLK